MPERNVDARHSRLVHGGNIGRAKPSQLGHDRECLDLAGAYLRKRIRGHVAHDVDLSADQISYRRRTAAIGHELEAGPSVVLKINPAQMRSAPGADRRGRRLVRVRLEPRDQLLQILCRQILSCDDPERGIGHPRHRFKVRQDVVCNRIDRAGSDVTRPVAEAQRVAIGRRTRASGNPDAAPCASHVLHDDRLAERLLEMLGQHSRERRGGPARRKRHDHGERSRGIGSRTCDAGHCRDRRCSACQMLKKPTALHGRPPFPC